MSDSNSEKPVLTVFFLKEDDRDKYGRDLKQGDIGFVCSDKAEKPKSFTQSDFQDGLTAYDLSLRSVSAPANPADTGRSLVIVALVGADLHIQIFDGEEQKVVAKTEAELMSGQELTDLKMLLVEDPFPDASQLSQATRQQIIDNATLVSGHTRLTNGLNDAFFAIVLFLSDSDSEKSQELPERFRGSVAEKFDLIFFCHYGSGLTFREVPQRWAEWNHLDETSKKWVDNQGGEDCPPSPFHNIPTYVPNPGYCDEDEEAIKEVWPDWPGAYFQE